MCAALLAAVASSEVSRTFLDRHKQDAVRVSCKKPVEVMVTLLWLLHSCEGYLCIQFPNDQIIHNLREVFMFFLAFHVATLVRNMEIVTAM